MRLPRLIFSALASALLLSGCSVRILAPGGTAVSLDGGETPPANIITTAPPVPTPPPNPSPAK